MQSFRASLTFLVLVLNCNKICRRSGMDCVVWIYAIYHSVGLDWYDVYGTVYKRADEGVEVPSVGRGGGKSGGWKIVGIRSPRTSLNVGGIKHITMINTKIQ